MIKLFKQQFIYMFLNYPNLLILMYKETNLK